MMVACTRACETVGMNAPAEGSRARREPLRRIFPLHYRCTYRRERFALRTEVSATVMSLSAASFARSESVGLTARNRLESARCHGINRSPSTTIQASMFCSNERGNGNSIGVTLGSGHPLVSYSSVRNGLRGRHRS